ncbi:MAG: 50S ribosomal protein L24 [Planctomycetes bacterium]|nr:50S ribosomal protein L24 [Planctomycetota bacterium]
MHVKKGDTVEVITGDDIGARGKVLSVNPRKKTVVIEGVNTAYKHVKPSRRNPQGGRLQMERPIHISNVLPVNPKNNKAARVRFNVESDGTKQRVSADGSVIDTITKTHS